MIKEAIQHIESTAHAQGRQYDGLEYLTRPVYLPPAEPTPAELGVASLQAIADYLAANRDSLDLPKLVIHVKGPTEVALLGSLTGRHRARATYLRATADLPKLVLGQFVEREDMQIMLASRFAPGHDLDDALKIVSNVVSGTTREAGDDGVQQEVVVKRGAASKERSLIRRTYQLAPFRTFAEVEQPASPFVLRIRGDEEEIAVGLFEADGGEWRGRARESVAAWLAERCPDVAVLR